MYSIEQIKAMNTVDVETVISMINRCLTEEMRYMDSPDFIDDFDYIVQEQGFIGTVVYKNGEQVNTETLRMISKLNGYKNLTDMYRDVWEHCQVTRQCTYLYGDYPDNSIIFLDLPICEKEIVLPDEVTDFLLRETSFKPERETLLSSVSADCTTGVAFMGKRVIYSVAWEEALRYVCSR